MQQRKSWPVTWMVPLVFLVVAGLEAAMAGSVIGLMYVDLLSSCGENHEHGIKQARNGHPDHVMDGHFG